MQVVFTEEVVVEVDELGLPQCRKQLSLLHTAQSAVGVEFSTAARHRTA